ncbi:hypothetical protein K0M31_003078 [Melipona bicolor]|uniref:Uncharacterized protein n=1 Tax=Melipona bicolor TaxID=60889 RepID=A0AA40G0E9_9HYME|nr:hypothetical protein K0M31_003078 [Melipona bicolor]
MRKNTDRVGRRRALWDGSYEPRHTKGSGAVVVVWGSQEGGMSRIEAEDENGKVT